MLHDRQAAWLLVFWCLFWFWGLLYLVVAVIRLIEGPDAMGWALADIPVSTARAVMYGTFTVYLVVVGQIVFKYLGREKMSTFRDDLIQSLNEALAHAEGDGPAILHAPVTPREVREHVNLTQAQMAPLMGMSLSGYRKWEQETRRVSGPAATLLRVIEREPEAVKRALLSSSQG